MSKIEQLIQQLCPEGVEYKRLGEVCEIKGRIGFRGYTRNDLVEESEGAITLSPSNIINQQLDFSNCSYISWFKYEESPEIKANVGDIVFTKTASVGKTALIKQLPKEATINPQLVLLKDIKCNAAYLSYVVKGGDFQSAVRKITGIGSVPNVPQSALAELLIPLPPLPVQQEIVRILDAFTQLEAELEAELEARKKQYEFYRDTLLSFEHDDPEVEWKRLGEVCEIGTGSSNGRDAVDNGIYPFFVRSQIVKAKDDYEFDEEAIIIPGEGGIGEIFHYIKGKYALHQRVYRIHFLTSEISVRFAYFYMQSAFKDFIMRKAVSATVTSIRKPMIEAFEIPLPPLSVQQEIVRILDKFSAITTDLQSGLPAEIEARKKQYEYYRDRLLTFKVKN